MSYRCRVNGPGSGTSDSILTKASNGEFMMRQKAVSNYGLRFIDAINRGLVPVQRVREIMSGISFDGLGRALGAGFAPQLAFREGGAVMTAAAASNGGGRSFTLALDGQSYPVSGARMLSAPWSATRRRNMPGAPGASRNGIRP